MADGLTDLPKAKSRQALDQVLFALDQVCFALDQVHKAAIIRARTLRGTGIVQNNFFPTLPPCLGYTRVYAVAYRLRTGPGPTNPVMRLHWRARAMAHVPIVTIQVHTSKYLIIFFRPWGVL